MNRQIKFRAWNESKNRFLDNEEIANTLISVTNEDGSQRKVQPLANLILHNIDIGFKFQQFTGLFDSKGKEIYEGDIILSQKETREVRFGEFWNGEDIYNGFFLQDPEIKHRNFGCSRIDRFVCSKVVGNIHQNPELLAA